jgi:hypothetical protein
MESFVALLQNNVLNRRRSHTKEELRLGILSWIERTYHRRRRQRALGELTPIEFEAVHDVLMHRQYLQPYESTEVRAVPTAVCDATEDEEPGPR